MGAQTFQHHIEAETPDAAFQTLVAEADAAWGHQSQAVFSGAPRVPGRPPKPAILH